MSGQKGRRRKMSGRKRRKSAYERNSREIMREG